MTLNQDGDRVWGTYSYECVGETWVGQIENGRVEKDALKFHWTQGTLFGDGTSQMSADGRSWSGSHTGQPNYESGNPSRGSKV